MPFLTDSNESKTLRLRLVALLSLYDLLPPSFDKAAFLDFNSPPPFDAAAVDTDIMLRSLVAIARKLHIPESETPLSPLFGGHGSLPRYTGTAGAA